MTESAEHKRSKLEPFVWFALTFGVYLALASPTFYKTDGPDLFWLFDEHRQHPWHLGYLPLFRGWHWLLHLFSADVSLMRVGTSFSALGMAIGVSSFVAGLQRLGISAGRRDTAAILLAAGPGALLFATVVELHAPLMAMAGIAFWWTTVQVQRPSWAGMLLLGVLTHGCFVMHSSGLLLPGWLLPFFLARRMPAGRRDWLLAAAAGFVHALLWFALPRLFPSLYGLHADLAAAFAKETSINRPQSVDYAGEIFVQEWLWPLMPVSVLCFAAALRRELRAEFVAFAVGMGPFLYLCVRQLVHEPENGAYLLPMTMPAVLLTVQALRPRVSVAAAVLGAMVALLSLGSVVPFYQALDDGTQSRRLVRNLEAAAQQKPFLALFGTHREMSTGYEALVRWNGPPVVPSRSFLYIRETAAKPRADYMRANEGAGIVGVLQSLIAADVAVLVPERTRSYLADPGAFMRAEKATAEVPPDMAGPQLLRDLEAAFTFVPGSEAGDGEARVFRLQPK